MNLATIALHVAAGLPANRPRTLSHAGYTREILPHAGLFFDGIAVQAERAETLVAALDAHGRPTARAAVTERPLGAGRAILIALDLTGSVVLIQQGRFVDMDAAPAPDAGGGTTDGMLKAEDGMVLDWH